MRYSIPFFLFLLNVQANGHLWIYRKSKLCDYNFKHESERKNDNNTTVGYFNSSFIYFCPSEEISVDNLSYVHIYKDDGPSDYPDNLQIKFFPPKRECMLGIALLFNPLIKDQEECHESIFKENSGWEIHSIEKNVCIFNHDNPFTENLIEPLLEDKVSVEFQYIFKGCYAVRFQINHKRKYVVSDPVFINSTYQRTEVKEPQLICRYNERHDPEKSQMTNFSLDIWLPPDTGTLLQVALIEQQNKDPKKKFCVWEREGFSFVWLIDLAVDGIDRELTDQHCDVKFVETVKGKYNKRVWCNFHIKAQASSSCFVYNLIDQRCTVNTIWKPPSASKSTPCLWVMQCVPIYEHWRHIEVIEARTQIQSETLLGANSYLLLPIIAVVLIVSAVIGILCFRRYLRIRREEINLYVNSQHDDSNCLKSTDARIVDNNTKETDHDNPSCDNIVLVYTNNSASFMALMKDFRKALAKMCSCSIYDWHDGTVWNEVAKVGAVSWFTELFNNGCRVVWIDTPATRYVVTSNSKNGEPNLDQLGKYYEIHDFRDMAFRVVLEVAKSRISDFAQQYRRHFVVRFEGLESAANEDDPFLNLCSHTRYYIPQHLMQLYLDLSAMKPETPKCKTKINEDVCRMFVYKFYKSQISQRLKSMKIDSI